MRFQPWIGSIGLALVLAGPAAAHGMAHPFGLELHSPAAPVDLRPSLYDQGAATAGDGARGSPDGEAAARAAPAEAAQEEDSPSVASADPALDRGAVSSGLVASAQEPSPKENDAPGGGDPSSKSGQAGSLDFDLLGTAAAPAQIDGGRLRLRRTMLTAHQGMGLALVGLQLATTVVGQLNYSDKFGANTGKYKQPHAILAYADLGVFAGTGLLALLAPKAVQEREGFDRISLHKVAMFTAATGMASQAVLGIITSSREGYLNQKSIGTAHLVIGYVTLAAIVTGVSAIVF